MPRRYEEEGYDTWDGPEGPPAARYRPPARRPTPPPVRRRSHAAIGLALAVFFAGLVLGLYSILIPALLGVGLLYVAFSFLSSRLNPFSLSFYLTTKPSWLSIGTLAFVGLVLVGVAWGYYANGFGPIAPGIHHLP